MLISNKSENKIDASNLVEASNSANAPDLLQVQSLCWSVDSHLILKQLSFSIECGEFVGIIGPNGSGKSSLLRCLYRKNIPTSGTIHFFQHPIESYSRACLAQKIAVVLQEPPSQFELTVLDVVRMGLIPGKKLLSFDTQQDRDSIVRAVAQVDLEDKLEQTFNSLSGGEKQRAMIARAILQAPKLLLMDEPTNHLDVRHQVEVLELARSLGITVLVSIHDLNLAANYCDRLILLNRGEIVAQGKPSSVLTESLLNQVFAVNAHIDEHPYSKKLRITFDYGSMSDGSMSDGSKIENSENSGSEKGGSKKAGVAE